MPRLILWCGSLGLCAGITTGEFFRPPILVLGAATAAAVAALGFRRTRLLAWAGLGVVIGLAVMLRMVTPGSTDIVHRLGQSMVIEGSVVHPPTHRDTSQTITLVALRSSDQTLSGGLFVTTSTFVVVPTGSRLRVSCQPEALTAQSRWRLWSRGVHARCTSTNVRIVQAHEGGWRSMLGRWQERILTYVRQHYNEPQASLLNGVLIGNTDGMPERINQFFQITGTTHIVALSGFNVTMISNLVMVWMVQLVGRRWAWIPSLTLVITFVVMSGASASVVRAATMAVIVQLGLWFGRPIGITRLLIYTAGVMVLANPLLLWHDLGFQLSFLATIGLVALSAPLVTKLSAFPEQFGLRTNVATTLGAMLMTEPLLLWRFGRLSLVAPLVNVVVLPLIPLAMGVGCASLLGLWWPPVSAVLVPVTDVVLRVIVWLISVGAGLPQSMVYLPSIVTAALGLGCSVISWQLMRHHAPAIRPA